MNAGILLASTDIPGPRTRSRRLRVKFVGGQGDVRVSTGQVPLIWLCKYSATADFMGITAGDGIRLIDVVDTVDHRAALIGEIRVWLLASQRQQAPGQARL